MIKIYIQVSDVPLFPGHCETSVGSLAVMIYCERNLSAAEVNACHIQLLFLNSKVHGPIVFTKE